MNMLNHFENAKKPDLAVDVQVVLNNDFNLEMDGGGCKLLEDVLLAFLDNQHE